MYYQFFFGNSTGELGVTKQKKFNHFLFFHFIISVFILCFVGPNKFHPHIIQKKKGNLEKCLFQIKIGFIHQIEIVFFFFICRPTYFRRNLIKKKSYIIFLMISKKHSIFGKLWESNKILFSVEGDKA